MKKELKQKWIDALRSGKYTQGRSYLCRDENFCCLGILCDIMDPNKWMLHPTSGVKTYEFSEGIRVNSIIPDSIRKKIGLNYKDHDKLISLNDDKRRTFHEIADYIEANVTGE